MLALRKAALAAETNPEEERATCGAAGGGHLGHHFIVEVFGCAATVLDDARWIERALLDAVERAGMHVIQVVMHKFSPQGVTGIIAVEESHVSIHTWPEIGYAAVDLFTCGSEERARSAVEGLVARFAPRSASVLLLRRPDLATGAARTA
jgi:S-adenosylmethionine decarboxylase